VEDIHFLTKGTFPQHHDYHPSPRTPITMAKQSADVSSSRRKSRKVCIPALIQISRYVVDFQAQFSAASNERRKIMSAPLSKELRKQYKVPITPSLPLSISLRCCVWRLIFRFALSLSAKTTKFSLHEDLLKVVKDESFQSTERNGLFMSNV